MPPHYTSREERFWERTDQSGGPDACWEWQAGKHSNGYGWLKWNSYPSLAHRVAYELTYGPVPPGIEVLHRCDNRPCCNPHHFFLGTQAENMEDMVDKGRSSQRAWHGRSKLTESDVAEIRTRFASGKISKYKLAIDMGISQRQIGRIISRKHW